MRYAWTELPWPARSLDPDRRFYRSSRDTVEIGKQWLVHGYELAVRVPSVVVPVEDNVLLNPHHQDFDALDWETQPFELDARLI
jgi:RES domain-containing protein